MRKNCYQTSIRWDNALREDWVIPPIPKTNSNGIWHYPHGADQIFKKEWVEEWKDRGVPFLHVMLFWRPAWFTNVEAHIDVFGPASKYKRQLAIGAFNAIIGGTGSNMLWFDLPKTQEVDHRITAAGTSYLSWPISSLKEVERRVITGPNLSLVRVDRPHAIYVRSEPRWCISLRTSDMMAFPSWDAMVDSYLKLGIIKD